MSEDPERPRPGRAPGTMSGTGTVDAEPFDLGPLRERLDHLPPERAELVLQLAEAAYRRAQVERLRDVARAAARFADALGFVERRRPDTLALRVFNPTEADHGWTADGTIVEVNTEDHPFLLSTVTEELARQGLEVAELVHPVIGVERLDDGGVAAITAARGARNRESYVHVELAARLPDDRLGPLAADLHRVLGDARRATHDFQALRERVAAVGERARSDAPRRYPAEEVSETAALLEWLLDDHFVLLGARGYEIAGAGDRRYVRVEPGSGLGILHDEATSTYAEPVPLDDIEEPLRSRITGGQHLTVARTNRRSTVHRQVRMVYVGVKRVDESGAVCGEDRFLGLFAQKAFAEPASSIPVLRRKLRHIIEREDVVEHSYDERALRSLFEAFPKHELFAVSTDDLRRTLVSLLETAKRQNVRLLCHLDERGVGVSVLVSLPRERFSAALRKRLQQLLVERFRPDAVDYQLSLTERDQALLHFQLHADQRAASRVSVPDLERDVVALTRTWDDRLREGLLEARGPAAGGRLAVRWAGRLPAGYQAQTDPATAVADLAELDGLLGGGDDSSIVLQRDPGGRGLRFKLYRRGRGVELSQFLPVLESLGFVVVEVAPHEVEVAGPGGEDVTLYLHDFGVRLPGGVDIDPDEAGPRLADAARAIWRGEAEADSMNRLVLRAGLAWDDVALLRAYRRYRRQVGTSFTEAYQDNALVEHPEVARRLVALFAAHFDPDRPSTAAAWDAALAAVHDALEAVERLDQDRILRGLLGMVEATVRTNRYVRRHGAALALKIDSAQVPDLPKPVPYVETFVYTPELEGLHLRGGLVARGGVRHSDRLEDFRAEVLGLMKAQMVKNAVIVPAGAKGGFVVKRPPDDPGEVRRAVRQAYETYVRALLDITDTVVGDGVVPPARVRRRDGDDPYLVVAPDKGTATFSDLANGISEEYGFWLGDAFASGGSSGYDHKVMGITARGAWVAVQRHFRELGTDVQAETVRAVGIGDMSGDVFGNGLLQSRALKLVAAFDHRHVFVDPDPDPERSWQERTRLFELPGSSWDDYDRSVLSRGGGVWPRSVKAIELPPEAQAVLRLDSPRVSPPELVKAILRAPVDLLFAGGVGTFVKARGESHDAVGDRANEGVRIDATELGARVVGEGANLALTQRARIQYARRGGRCNTDAIDNSAGVDTSDREVNLKILLRLAAEHGALAPAERDELLRSLEPDVGEGALRNVYLQTWRLSQEVAESPGSMEVYEQLMSDLERAGGEPGSHGDPERPGGGRLDRGVESLPSSVEMRRRREAGAGMTRPELAVLLAYAKVDLRAKLLACDLVTDPSLRAALVAYFPTSVVERFDDLLDRHRLRNELVATVVASDLVNRMGIAYTNRMCREFGVPAREVAAAYWAAREVVDADRHWRDVEALDQRTDPALQIELKGEVDQLVDAFVRAYLRQGMTTTVATIVERDQPVFAELAKVVADLGSPGARARRRARADRYADLGIDDELADRIVTLADLVIVPDVAEVARRAGAGVRHVAELFSHLSEVLPFEKLYLRLAEIEPATRWERWQQRGLLDELRQVRRDSAVRILAEGGDAGPEHAVSRFLAARGPGNDRWRAMIEALDADPDAGLAAVAVTVRVLREALSAEPVA